MKTITTNDVMRAIRNVERIDELMKTATPIEKIALWNEWKKLDAERCDVMRKYHEQMKRV